MGKIEKNSKRKVWTKSETRLFLSCYKARKEAFTHTRGKRNGYAKVLKDMISQGFEDTSLGPSSLEGKMRTLLLTYKSAKDSARQTGKRCKAPFMAELDELFCEKTVERNGPTVTFKETVHIPIGKPKSRPNKCRLCLNPSREYKSLFDGTGRATTVYSTTIKYFDPMHLSLTQEYPEQQIAVCLLCWSRICEFDSFKYSVLLAQSTMSNIKPTPDDGKKLERYFGKQDGYDPLAVAITVKNEADNEMDDAEENSYSDDDMSNGDDIQDDASVSDDESDQDVEENEGSLQSADTDNEYTKESNPIPEPQQIEQPKQPNQPKQLNQPKSPKAEDKKPTAKVENNIEFRAKTQQEGKFVKLISKYREPDEKKVDVHTSSKNDIGWSSNSRLDLSLYAERNESYCEDNSGIDYNEYGTYCHSQVDLDKDVSATHMLKPEFGCNACGKSAFSPEALSRHVCRASHTKL